MKIEVLFPEYASLYGDYGNIMYLKACLPKATFIQTSMRDEPRFLKEKVNLVYMGAMSEKAQEKIIRKLMPWKEQIRRRIDEGMPFLMTGNAMEVFYDHIQDGNRKIPGLGLIPYHAVRDMDHRFNGLFLGEFRGKPLVGCKTQFTMAYGGDENCCLAKALRGIGINKGSDLEGYRKDHFFGTNLVGPLLVLNPEFTKYLLHIMGADQTRLAFEKEVTQAYECRLKEFEDPKTEV